MGHDSTYLAGMMEDLVADSWTEGGSPSRFCGKCPHLHSGSLRCYVLLALTPQNDNISLWAIISGYLILIGSGCKWIHR